MSLFKIFLRKKTYLLAAILFSGCINFNQEVHIYPDGSGKMFIHYWMAVPDSQNVEIFNTLGIFNPDSIRKEFESVYTKIEDVEVYYDSSDSTTHAKLKFSFSSIDSLNLVEAFKDSRFRFEDGAPGQKIFSQFIPPIATGFGIDGKKFRVTYRYTFSGEVITHNATEEDGKALVWSYNLSEIGSGKTISVTIKPYKLKETPVWIYVISGIVLLIVIIFLFRKKKD
ncbi:MAG: hypothetical protein HXY49_08115 [Ignavibacteriaceae bacterium]|nr:hypothetical protein [Ignavibacteriaceae bacterium]